MRTTVSNPASMISLANAWIFSNGYGGLDAKSVQPMKFSAHSCASSEKSYTVASLAWIRLAMQSFTKVFAEGYSFSVSLVSMLPSYDQLQDAPCGNRSNILAKGMEGKRISRAISAVEQKDDKRRPETKKAARERTAIEIKSVTDPKPSSAQTHGGGKRGSCPPRR